MKSLALFSFSLLVSCFTFTAQAQCTAGFDTTISGLQVNFTNQATGNYNWMYYDFGDGGYVYNVANPSHNYANAGIYITCQSIQDTVNFNCYDYACDTLFLGGATCQADFSWWSDNLTTYFYGYSLGNYTSTVWSFGDGSANYTGVDPTHTYSSFGTFNVCLYLYNGSNICDSVCYDVYIAENDCFADFSENASGLTVDFTNESSGGYTTQNWDFGDGFGTSQDNNPSYTYFIAGSYQVCLSVYDTVNGICYDDTCREITVTGGGGGSLCAANFTYSKDQLNVNFTNTSTGSVQLNTWDFGDGSNPDFTESPSHAYAAAGTYEVCLTVLSIFPFCTDTKCSTITVNEYTCEPSFTYTFNEQNGFQFINTTTVGNVTSVSWSFGDGNSSTFNNPQYFYNAPGTYNVCLTTFDNGNECGQTCADVEVYPLGLNDLNSSSAFRIYPNPSKGQFTVELNDQADFVGLDVMDLSGRKLHTFDLDKGINKASLELALPSGAYFLMARSTSGSTYTQRLMIN